MRNGFQARARFCTARLKPNNCFSDYTQDNYKLAQINHYALGAMQSFILKAMRGRSGSSYQGLNMDYWCDRNFCQEEDKTIQRHNTALIGEIERLRGDAKMPNCMIRRWPGVTTALPRQ